MKKIISVLIISLFIFSIPVESFGQTKKLERPNKGTDSNKDLRGGGASKPVENKFNYKTFKVNGVSFDMVPVKGGTFMMGSNDGYPAERPVHAETVSDFMIGKTEVTQELWRAVMGNNPSYFSGEKNPVEQVSWSDCIEFISRLNQITGQSFRLPTEAEWEYAARGGDKSRGYTYSGGNELYLVGWIADNSGYGTHQVATLQPNELGIFDMLGNVWEWTSDIYSNNYNEPRNTSDRVSRGGSWNISATYCRIAFRGSWSPGSRYFILGMRLAL